MVTHVWVVDVRNDLNISNENKTPVIDEKKKKILIYLLVVDGYQIHCNFFYTEK